MMRYLAYHSFFFRKCNRSVFPDGVYCEICVLSEKVEIFQTTNEPS